ncbi:SDR family NAD(P)-dependent oxidoreductase [Amycolatopsis halotolerans]|uniref:SDR family NAD(P)-dependent oxidoreductase n=1 Tax=Amycolatopsis halotolerans TaxID=330083 RepID=A0ABV7QDH1_9PSEU
MPQPSRIHAALAATSTPADVGAGPNRTAVNAASAATADLIHTAVKTTSATADVATDPTHTAVNAAATTDVAADVIHATVKASVAADVVAGLIHRASNATGAAADVGAGLNPAVVNATANTDVATDLIRTAFNATSTAADVVAGLDLTGIRAVVTGATSGLGRETARALASAGADVTLAVRNPSAGKNVADAIAASTGNHAVRAAHLELADLATVAHFTASWDGPLHLLINNAGVMRPTLGRTPLGWELQFATNHLGHFALALGLHDALTAGANDRGAARIVAVTSGAHMYSSVVFDDIHFTQRAYDPQLAYGQSKTANSLFAVEATRRWAADGIVANAVNPGGVSTGLQRDFTQDMKDHLDRLEAAGVFAYKTIEQGAATTLVAATAPEFAHNGGHYLDDGNEAETVPDDADLADNSHAVKRWARDEATARRLWEVSLDLVRQH